MPSESIVMCTLKKSAHVTERLIVYTSYAVVTIVSVIALTVILGWTFINVIIPGLYKLWSDSIAPIPWFAWILIGAIIAIFGYSFLWCIARDLTEDDWISTSANNFALAVAAFAVAALAVAVNPVDRTTIWYYVFRFFGAVWNHYKTKKE